MSAQLSFIVVVDILNIWPLCSRTFNFAGWWRLVHYTLHNGKQLEPLAAMSICTDLLTFGLHRFNAL